MVDVSVLKPIGEVAVTRVAAPTPVTRVASATSEASASPMRDTAATSGLAQSMAASPPVDTDRVAKIKRAIEEGTFPLVPAQIADRLIALKLQWNPNGAGQHDEA